MGRGEEVIRKVNLGLRKGIYIKMFLVLLWLTIRKVVVSNLIILLAQFMERNSLVSVSPVLVDAMDVGIMFTR